MNYPFDKEKLEALVEAGEISKTKHPEHDLWIYSYLKSWYPEWTEELKWARGLVLDASGKVIACPFKKFFNYGEVQQEIEARKDMPYTVQMKLDGSLGILFSYQEEWHLCTRGSFTSVQAVNGKRILEQVYPGYGFLSPEFTYLFEIIYPENQIVVKYDCETLVLLAVMDPTTMTEVNLDKIYLPQSMAARRVNEDKNLSLIKLYEEVKSDKYENEEGFVVKYDDGYRVKFKYNEYVRIHKIVSDFRPIKIVESMRDGVDVEAMAATVPDEFRKDIMSVKEKVENLYSNVNRQMLVTFKEINTSDRKTFALEVQRLFSENKLFAGGLFVLWQVEHTPGKISNAKDKLHSIIFDILLKQMDWNE